MSTAYKNSKRQTGSQREVPRVTVTDGVVQMSGYQRYTLTRNAVTPQSYAPKFAFIQKFIASQYASGCRSIADLGCSNGMVCFMANQIGYDRIHALDHDLDCLKVIDVAKDALNFDTVRPQQYSFGDSIEKVDVLIMGALIHWVFSCTALYGSFDKIISYLRENVGRVLLIEWVDTADAAIKAFKHIKYNPGVVKEAYTRQNFINSLRKHFKSVDKVFTVRNTRELFIAHV